MNKADQTHRPNILYIHHGYGIGGAPLSLLFLLRQLDRTKYNPTVACLAESEAADLYRQEGIETIILSGIDRFGHTNLTWYGLERLPQLLLKLARFVPSILRTRNFLLSRQFDLVHLNSSTLYPSGIGAKLAGTPVVWHIREPIARGYFGLRREILKWIIDTYADRIIAICQNDADQLRAADKIRVIYNFVNFEQFDRRISGEPFRREFALSPATKTVGMLGGVAAPKGTLDFVRAAARLRPEMSNFRFFIVGQYPTQNSVRSWLNRYYFHRIKKVIDQHNLHDQIIFTGVRRDIPQVLAGLDLLAFPSTVPHFARPIIEAGAMAVPVVASDLGGPRELVAHNQTGLLVPPRDPARLAQAIGQILADETLAHQMGEAGYQRAKQLYNAQTNAAATFAVYEEILGQQKDKL